MSVVNGLGAPVASLALSRRRHACTRLAGPLAPGARAVLQPVRVDARHIVPADLPLSAAVRAPLRTSTGGSYLAVLERSPFWEPGVAGVDRARQLSPRARVAGRAAMSEPMLQLDGLVRHFDGVRAVDDVSFSVDRGQVLGFIGPNGAGKTTTMRILATLDSPQGGDARIGGYSVVDDPEKVRRITGFMPDYAGVYANTTVAEYLDFFARAHDLRGDDAAQGGRQHHRLHGHRRSARSPRREPVEGAQAARRARPRHHPRSRGADPRRAGRQPRSAGAHRVPHADPRAGRRRQDDPPQLAHPDRARRRCATSSR